MTENSNSFTSEAVKAGDNESATVTVNRRIKPEQVDAFKSAIDEVTKAVRSFPFLKWACCARQKLLTATTVSGA